MNYSGVGLLRRFLFKNCNPHVILTLGDVALTKNQPKARILTLGDVALIKNQPNDKSRGASR